MIVTTSIILQLISTQHRRFLGDTGPCSKKSCENLNETSNRQCGPLAQSVERGADNAKVVSSSLTRTNFFHFDSTFSLVGNIVYSMVLMSLKLLIS